MHAVKRTMQVAIAITGLDLTIAIAIHVQDVGLYTIGLCVCMEQGSWVPVSFSAAVYYVYSSYLSNWVSYYS